jgi:HEAT repeat protein
MRLAAALSVGLLAIPALGTPAAPDLDVGIPSGSPLEWIENIPSTAPDSYRGAIPRAVNKNEGTVLVPSDPKKPEATSIFNYVKVITWDLPTHLKWYGEMPRKPDEKTIPTGGGLKITIEYPPQVPPDLFWLASATYIRKLLHPCELNDAETIQYLIFLGEPSLMAAEAARSQPGAKEYVDAVTAAVDPMPSGPPLFDKTKTEYEHMMLRLTYEDLVTDFPFSLEQKFCTRISQLGDEPFEYVVRAANNTHKFLRRNAVYQLGRYTSAKATEELRKIFLKNRDEDPVVRNRAIEALARKRDAEIVPEIVKRVKGGDRNFKAYAIYALGLIGSADGAKVVHEQLKNHSSLSSDEDFDVATSSIIALGRMKCGDSEAIVKTLENLLKTIEGKNIPDPAPTLKPDLGDRPNTRKETLTQLTAIALANTAPDRHAQRIYDLIEASKKATPPIDPSDPRAKFFASRYAKGMLRGFHPMTVNFLLDTLPRLEKGKDYLQEIIKDVQEDEVARSYALFKLATATYDTFDQFVKPYLDIDRNPPAIVETALQAIFRSNRKEGLAAAKEIVKKFLASPAPSQTPGARPPARPVPPPQPQPGQPAPVVPAQPFNAHKRYIAGLCLKILGSLAETDVKTLTDIIRKEVPRRVAQKKAEEEAKKPPPPAPPPAPPKPGQPVPPVRPGFNPTQGLWQAEFNAPDALLETALIELGRLRKPESVSVISEVLDNKECPARAEACLALGAIAVKPAVDRLVAALEDEDGWVRFMAYRTLKDLSGADHFCDWIYDSAEKRAPQVAEWKKWAEGFQPASK